MSRASIVWFLIVAGLGGWWYSSYAEKEAKSEQARLERERLETRRLQHQDSLMRYVGCMANHASSVSQMSAAQAIVTFRSGANLPREDYAEFEKMRNSLMSECNGPYAEDVKKSYPDLTSAQLNGAFLKVMAEDPQVVTWLKTFNMISDVERKAYVK
jgi:hypothetical protein